MNIGVHTGQNDHHNQINKQQVLARLWRKRNPSIDGNAIFPLLLEMHTGVATVENSMEFPQKSKNWTAFWRSNSTTGIIP